MPKKFTSLLSPPTNIQDFDMLDSNAIEQRPTLSTSLSDFALFPSSSSAPASPSALSALEEGISPFFRRIRRSSLLAAGPINLHSDAKPQSPLASSFVPRPRRAHSFDSEKMNDDASASSETPSASSSIIFTGKKPSGLNTTLQTPTQQPRCSSTPSSPPQRPIARSNDDIATLPQSSIPPKHTRLLDIRNETDSSIESELKSEAQFQRLVASWANSGLPVTKPFPRTPRSWSDRGRFPEEAGHDDNHDNDPDDSEDDDIGAPGSVHSMSTTPSGSSITPSGSGGEDQTMMTPVDTSAGNGMDVDTPVSHSAVNSPTVWRQTPPPTSRPGKRKFEDRYEPYPVSKRRAVSPALHHHAMPHSRSGSSPYPHPHPTLTIPIPIPVPRNGPGPRSVTSSPVMRPVSSPTMRTSSFGPSFGSPTARPIARLPPIATLRGGSDSERERERQRKSIDGAGEAVSSLTLS